MVIHIGGSTTSVSVIHLDGQGELVYEAYDYSLYGGNDIDEKMCNRWRSQLVRKYEKGEEKLSNDDWLPINVDLKSACKSAKEKLLIGRNYSPTLEFCDKKYSLKDTITVKEFDRDIAVPFCDHIFELID